jgi:hypothetical protein
MPVGRPDGELPRLLKCMPAVRVVPRAVSKVKPVIASGWDIRETWLAFTSMVLAPMMDKLGRQQSTACRDHCTAARLAANLVGASDPIGSGIRAGDSVNRVRSNG